MRWIKKCVRKEPQTYTIIKVPNIITQDFIDWVNNKVTSVSLVIESSESGSICYVDYSETGYDEWEVVSSNSYIVVNDITGGVFIYTDSKELWNDYEELRS